MSAPWLDGLRFYPEDAILVACECSGVVRDALIDAGYPAVSCDIKPTEAPGPHIERDVRDVLHHPWRGLIAHPVCRVLANSGSKWLFIGGKKVNGPDPERWAELDPAIEFCLLFENARHIPRRAWENSIMHGYAQRRIGRPQNFIDQPHYHGDPFFKPLAWWTHNLPDIAPTQYLKPPRPGTDEHKQWSAVHRAPPGPERAANRARFHAGPARAIAAQWGPLFGTPVIEAQHRLFPELDQLPLRSQAA